MIRPRYALKLARTKLRSKRGMLAASVIVSSLLFAVLIAGIIVFTGAEKSAVTFIEKANNDRYLVEVNPVIPHDTIAFSQDLSLEEIHQIKAFEKQYYEELRAKYDELDIPYSESQEIPALLPASWKSTSLPEEQRVQVNHASPVITKLLEMKYEEYAKTAKNKLSDLEAIGAEYGASGYYTSRPTGLPTIPGLRLIQDGKENFEDSELQSGNASLYGYFTHAVYNGMYAFQDDQLVQRYLLPSADQPLEGVPVVISAQEAVRLFGNEKGLGDEPENSDKKAQWLAQVQDKINGQTYQVCYRNSAELELLDKIQQDYAEMVANQDNEDYQKPSLIYDYPTEPCGDIIVKEDTRTTEEKGVDQTQIDNQKKLGTYIEPRHELLTFQIVGIINAEPYSDYSTDIESYIKNLITVENKTSSAIIPLQLYNTLSEDKKFDDLLPTSSQTTGTSLSEDFATHVVQFKTIGDARRFMSEQTCPGHTTDCGKLFTADPYGSNYLILDEIGKMFGRIMSYALPVMLVLATVIIWFTMVRVMSENRKETAVYRAMGAKRRDIVAIYLLYSAILALRIVILSLVLGIAAAYAIDYFYGTQLTDVASVAFGTIAETPRFSLFDLSSPLILWVVLGVFIVVLIAIAQPLIRNVLRSPIEDMRTE